MRMRNKRTFVEILRSDFNTMVKREGQTVKFMWTEMTDGVWNETYQVFEGGAEEVKEYEIKGVGKVVDYREEQMETEYGRIDIGECIVRFPYDVNFLPILNKERLRFVFRGQKWKLDLPLGIGDMYGDEYYTKIIKGTKVND